MDASSEATKIKVYNPQFHSWYYNTQEEHRQWLDRQLGYIVVYAGPRGSGKTLSMTHAGVSYLMSGHKVWSNYRIKFPVQWAEGEKLVWYESQPLDMDAIYTFDKELAGGVVLIDEINLWCSNRRSMSVANRLMNSVMQLLRKRKLTFCFTTQNFQWLDSQLRWQTDGLCECHDQYYSYPGRYEKGAMILQSWRDMSGVYTGRPFYETQREYRGFLAAKPFWNCYNTWEEFDIAEASRQIVVKREKHVIDERKDAWLNNAGNKSLDDALQELKSYGVNEMSSQEVQEYLTSNGFNLDARHVGRVMKQSGWSYKQGRKGNFYVLTNS
ncbi:MAG: AAA family ATPase [Dehalococcoidales bacterium]|nr:AAA family ATPase [Dehalococcoidales bacterium]